MKFRNQLGRILCGAGLALAFTVVPSTWGATQSSSKTQATAASAKSAQTAQVDINTASEDQLKAISGIGDVYAKRIIAGRPYSAKNQLVSKGVLPQGVYDKVKNQIVAHHAKK